MHYAMKLTATGAAKIAAAQAGGPAVALVQLALGTGGGAVVAPIGTETALAGEVWRHALGSVAISADDPTVIVTEAVMPSDVGGYWLRELGIFDAAGDLFAYGNLPETYKATAVEGSSRELIVRAAVRVASVASIELVQDLSVVTATRQWCLLTFLQKAQNLADLPDKAAARANLGLSDDFLASLRVPDAELYFAGAGF